MDMTSVTQTFKQPLPLRYPTIGPITFDENGEYIFVGIRDVLVGVTNILAQHNVVPCTEIQDSSVLLKLRDVLAEDGISFIDPDLQEEGDFETLSIVQDDEDDEDLNLPVSLENNEDPFKEDENATEHSNSGVETAQTSNPFADNSTTTEANNNGPGTSTTKRRRKGSETGSGHVLGAEGQGVAVPAGVQLDADGFPI